MNNMILIDLETQSFDVKSGIYEVACLAVEDYAIVDKLYLGKPIEGYKGENRYGFGFHNISRDRVCIEKFKEFIHHYKYPLVAHNCPFDRKFLLYYQWIDRNYPAYCSLRAVKAAVKTLGSYSLNHLVQHYHIAQETEHTAMSDTMNLYHLLRVVKPLTWVPLSGEYASKGKKKLG